MTTTLDGRLLCASVCAYSIQDDQSIAKCPPYDQTVAFIGTPKTFTDGPSKINACIVGRNADGVVLAFRGTLPPGSPNHEQTIRDWFNDFHALLVPANGISGLVHEGFWKALDSLWPRLSREVTDQLAGRKLYITGHSKGAGMANLAAMRFAAEKGIKAIVRTFAGPHPGSEAFARGYNATILDSIRYEYADDIVPHVPPSLPFRHMFQTVPFFFEKPDLAVKIAEELDYTSVGTLQFINWDEIVVPDSAMLRFRRFESLAKLLVRGGFETIVNDHACRCGSGYASAVCPSGVCP
jgi:hypothetical protein